MKDENKKYDWIVIGGGISGISVAEILVREGKSVLLLEKNEKLVSETSKVFHEWLHSGSLYSLVPDHLLTLRYLLGATDDLLEYYQEFPRMNLVPSESGIHITNKGWFNDQYIEYRYRIHRINLAWLSLVSRSINIIDLVSNHDWLRKRAGSEYGHSQVKYSHWVNNIQEIISRPSKFYSKLSPDLTMNSRLLISDFLSAGLQKGLQIKTGETVLEVREEKNHVRVETKTGQYCAVNSVICSPDVISKLMDIPIKTSFAPIAVVENVPENEKNFVELDYNTKKCINLLKKEGGIGQAGGISVDNEKDVDSYLAYVISEHKKRNPEIQVIDSYVGLKKELVQKGENRNYLYHINQNSSHVWSVILGKFTLAFSMAPEFYRRVYHKNPTKNVEKFSASDNKSIMSETSWQEINNKHRKKLWE
jgi:hypothetical protein